MIKIRMTTLSLPKFHLVLFTSNLAVATVKLFVLINFN